MLRESDNYEIDELKDDGEDEELDEEEVEDDEEEEEDKLEIIPEEEQIYEEPKVYLDELGEQIETIPFATGAEIPFGEPKAVGEAARRISAPASAARGIDRFGTLPTLRTIPKKSTIFQRLKRAVIKTIRKPTRIEIPKKKLLPPQVYQLPSSSQVVASLKNLGNKVLAFKLPLASVPLKNKTNFTREVDTKRAISLQTRALENRRTILGSHLTSPSSKMEKQIIKTSTLTAKLATSANRSALRGVETSPTLKTYPILKSLIGKITLRKK